MKIAILTQPLGHNYGGIMQAWALQQVLKRMGHEPITIDRQPDARGLAYRSARTVYRALRSAVGKSKGLVFPERVVPIVTKHTRDFIRTNLTMSPMIDSTEKLRAHFIDEGYQAVIVGSDQTWRPAYSPNIYNFFLDFLPDRSIKKIAYASSFGVDDWEFSSEQTLKCSGLASEFDFIGVRETSGVQLCKEHLNIVAELTLDPTLLLAENDYSSLTKEENQNSKRKGKTLYSYILDNTPEKHSFVQQLSERLGFSVFMRQAAARLTDSKDRPIEEYVIPPVSDWISGFKDADFVITDSFHGMVFSIIFGKPFLVMSNAARGSARFTSLLNRLAISERLITNLNKIDNSIIEAAFFHPKEDAINIHRKHSIAILSRYLS